MSFDLGADLVFAGRLLVAAALGALIGLEREIHDHPAGMRTHLLVSLGSAGFTVLSIAAFPAPGSDPARVAGATIRGLTTAASLWAVAAVGMAAGAGALLVALTITAIALISLWPLRLVAERFVGREQHRVRMRLAAADPEALARVVSTVSAHAGTLAHLATTPARAGGLTIDIEVRAEDVAAGAAITAAVAATDGISIEETSALGD
jgi:putative Mg2+ transporter-C (MgtC) family protein